MWNICYQEKALKFIGYSIMAEIIATLKHLSGLKLMKTWNKNIKEFFLFWKHQPLRLLEKDEGTDEGT